MLNLSKLVIGMTSVLILVAELALVVNTKQDNTASPQTSTAFNTSTAQIQESQLLSWNAAYNNYTFCIDCWPSLIVYLLAPVQHTT